MNALKKTWWPTLTALSMAMAGSTVAHADERESLETIRQTTLGLIDALVEKGVLTREAADGMIKQAQQRATATAKPQAVAPAVAESAKPEATAGGKPVLRVPYVPESMKAQIRNEVKEEILTQARAERWGVPNAVPSWVDRIKINGDFRFRYQTDRLDKDNTDVFNYFVSENENDRIIRAAPFASLQGSTNEGRDRERLRLRLGLTAKVTDEVGVGVRLATGSTTDRVSTNQTLGQGFNKYPLLVDRAFVRLDPADWVSLQAGRLPNPWFSTDMIWSENLNFEGLAATAHWAPAGAKFEPFATLGAFPLRESSPPTNGSRWLYGAQLGTAWAPSERTRLKFGLAYYAYKNLEGRQDRAGVDYFVDGADIIPNFTYGNSEYPAGLRQKGNTLFETNPTSPQALTPVWGLAYRFRPLALTASAELTHFSPYSLLISAEFVKNLGFDVADFQRRSALPGFNPGGQDKGYQLKMAFGAAEVREQHQWQAFASYRYLGSDAVLDAFTDSDMGLGGTNVQGYTLGAIYGLYRNTNVGVRYLASRNIDSPINDQFYPNARFRVNTLQVDLNVRF